MKLQTATTILLLLLLALTTAPPAAAQDVATLTPSEDNTLYESDTGTLSNGAGEHLFAGRTNQNAGSIRRALLAFDLSEIPASATVDSVRLTLNMSKTVAAAHGVTLHRALADWGEGTSAASGDEGAGADATTGDATWTHRFFDTDAWQTPGGDFEAAASDSITVEALGAYTWSSAQMAADVQGWLNDPASNFGWLLRGDESALRTAKRFDSSENATEANRPVLQVFYTTNPTAAEDEPVPAAFTLAQNYPNPFNPATTITFTLQRPQEVTLAVYDALGRRVATLAEGVRSAGTHRVTFDGTGLPSGVYRYRLATARLSQSRTMVLLK